MKKHDLVKLINENMKENDYSSTIKTVNGFLNALADVVAECLNDGEEIIIPGLVKCSVVDVPAHVGRNPMTGEAINIPDKKRVKVKAVNALKDSVR